VRLFCQGNYSGIPAKKNSAKRPSVVVSRIQKTFLVLRTPDRANGQALWMPSCFARKESAPYSNRKLIPQFACNGRSHGLAARRASAVPIEEINEWKNFINFGFPTRCDKIET
jgi:hypothetical protein